MYFLWPFHLRQKSINENTHIFNGTAFYVDPISKYISAHRADKHVVGTRVKRTPVSRDLLLCDTKFYNEFQLGLSQRVDDAIFIWPRNLP